MIDETGRSTRKNQKTREKRIVLARKIQNNEGTVRYNKEKSANGGELRGIGSVRKFCVGRVDDDRHSQQSILKTTDEYVARAPERGGVSGFLCVGRVDDDARGRCGKPRSVRFSKSLWARSWRPQGRQRPRAAFYVDRITNRS